jgi:MerR family copper efflux transcriptional regulator
MQIGELAGQVGISTKAIRYYESIGLLPAPHRAPNGYRDYDEDAVERLAFVRDAKRTGLTITEISSILDMREQGEATCEHVVSLLARHTEEIERQIKTLISTRDQLREATARALRLNPRECTDPNRCQTIEARTVTARG